MAYMLWDTTLFTHIYGIWLAGYDLDNLVFDGLNFFWAFHVTGNFFSFPLFFQREKLI